MKKLTVVFCLEFPIASKGRCCFFSTSDNGGDADWLPRLFIAADKKNLSVNCKLPCRPKQDYQHNS